MTKDDVIKRIVLRLSNQVDPDLVSNTLYFELNGYDIVEQRKNEIVEYSQSEDQKATQMFFVSKKVEGLSDRTLKYYKNVLTKFASVIVKPLKDITATDIRYYIAYRIQESNISKCTQNNERRVISTFFTWLTAEEYISRDPSLSVKKIKQEKRVKKPFSEEELELIRKACKNEKETAIVEFLYSTGCRCSELVDLRIENIDFNTCKVLVFGKGAKEREVFINAKCKIAISEYLASRDNPKEGPLFESQTYKGQSMKVSGIEICIRGLGKRAGVENCHPHRFRRTTATTALNRGMPIDQVQQMLGHEDIKTTTIYAITDKENLQSAHRKFVV